MGFGTVAVEESEEGSDTLVAVTESGAVYTITNAQLMARSQGGSGRHLA